MIHTPVREAAKTPPNTRWVRLIQHCCRADLRHRRFDLSARPVHGRKHTFTLLTAASLQTLQRGSGRDGRLLADRRSTIKSEAARQQLTGAMRPHQLGCGVPNGAVLVITATRAWTASAGEKNLDDLLSSPQQAVLGVDMETAYGRVYCSAYMEAALCFVPRLALLADTQVSLPRSVSKVHGWNSLQDGEGGKAPELSTHFSR